MRRIWGLGCVTLGFAVSCTGLGDLGVGFIQGFRALNVVEAYGVGN